MPQISLLTGQDIAPAPGTRNPGSHPDAPLRRLLDGPVRPGRVEWIGVRPARHAAVEARDEACLDRVCGVEGDHYAGRSGTRQVSLIGRENLRAIASFLGREDVPPDLLRRNFVIIGVNLLALKGRRFRLGAALLEWTGECHPCSRMEALLGPGGYNAVRGQGGMLARVLEPAAVRLGDELVRGEWC